MFTVTEGEIQTPDCTLGKILQQKSIQKFKTTQKLTTQTHLRRISFRNRKRDVYHCLSQFYFTEFRLRGSVVHGCMSMVLMSSMLQALIHLG